MNPISSSDVSVAPKNAGKNDQVPQYTKMQKKVLFAGSIGQFIDFYDFTIYGLTAVILAQHFFPSSSPFAGLLATFATYGLAFVARPLGGLYFGSLGDRIGRRRVLFITLLMIGLATTAMGLLPTFESIGVLAPILLVFLRLVQGFCTGGEAVGAASFVFEHAPINRRGFFINITLSATAVPVVFASLFILGLGLLIPEDSYLQWGWRIPFIISLPLSFFGLWIRSKTAESQSFIEASETHEKDFSPIRTSLQQDGKRMVQVFFVIGLTALCFYSLVGYFPSFMQTSGGLSREVSLLITAYSLTLYAVLLPISGLVSDRFGRKPMLIIGALTVAIVSIPAFLLVTSGNIALAVLGQTLYVFAVIIYGGGCYTFFVEIFTTKTRFTSAAISYNISYALFGGTAPFISLALVAATGLNYAPGIYTAIAAIIAFLIITLTAIPETRGRLDSYTEPTTGSEASS